MLTMKMDIHKNQVENQVADQVADQVAAHDHIVVRTMKNMMKKRANDHAPQDPDLPDGHPENLAQPVKELDPFQKLSNPSIASLNMVCALVMF